MPDNHTPSGDFPSKSDRIDEVVAEYFSAIERGETPNRDELLTRYPELADGLREFFANHDRLASFAGPLFEATFNETRSATPPERIRYFGDYEVLEEISRGGMGVVFKARQLTLNRIVAVKMILSGLLASQEDVERFHTEAEAAAKLDHPGIVPIYEVGQHDGHHYFSMGFVDGQSLAARVAQRPLPAREAAGLVRTVAGAVQYAHDMGVIHRDLKPGNVLLDRQGNPRITDFGLAKLTESHSDLTGTGQVLGTPGYMPPEQAAAHIGAVGPLSDIYSLGSILYCLLTGRPPFQAATPIETLLQVQKQEPVSPRQLNPALPLDLDTIVLKCLEKSPARRYASAKSLADELNRYLEGRPILARRVSRAEQFRRWCQRQPIVAGLSAAVFMAFLIGTTVSAYFAVKESERAKGESKEREEAQKQTKIAQQNLKQTVNTAVHAVENSRGAGVPRMLEILETLPRELVLAELKLRNADLDEQHTLGRAYAMAHFGQVDVPFLISQVQHSAPEEVDNFVSALGHARSASLDAIHSFATDVESKLEWRLKARLVVVALQLEDDRIANDMCYIDKRSDPVPRTIFIDELRAWHGDMANLAANCRSLTDPGLRSAVCMAIGSIPKERLTADELDEWKRVFTEWFQSAPDNATHSAAGWAQRQWGIESPTLSATRKPSEVRQWFVNSLGMTLLKIEPGAFVRKETIPGPKVETVKLTRAFFLSDREVSVDQFQKFIDDPANPDDDKGFIPLQVRIDFAGPLAYDRPRENVNWYNAIHFCNWLSRKEGRTPCYERTGKKEKSENVEYDAWRLVADATGYRLPTEAEWEFACRAGTTTDFASGSDDELLRKYAFFQASGAASCGSKLPNGWGLFDMHGNVAEWCNDWKERYADGEVTDPLGPSLGMQRVIRGGAWHSNASSCQSEHRDGMPPGLRSVGFGFRPALGPAVGIHNGIDISDSPKGKRQPDYSGSQRFRAAPAIIDTRHHHVPPLK